MDDDEDGDVFDLADADFADFAIVLPCVALGEDGAFEDAAGEFERDAVLGDVGGVLRLVPFIHRLGCSYKLY